MTNNGNKPNNSRGGSILKVPTSPRETRDGVGCAPSPRYERPSRPGGGGNNGR